MVTKEVTAASQAMSLAVASGEIDGFLVRKAEKQHGTGQRIEGFYEKPARVVIVASEAHRRATLELFEAADHSFHVPARSGRNDREVMNEILDALAAWVAAI